LVARSTLRGGAFKKENLANGRKKVGRKDRAISGNIAGEIKSKNTGKRKLQRSATSRIKTLA